MKKTKIILYISITILIILLSSLTILRVVNNNKIKNDYSNENKEGANAKSKDNNYYSIKECAQIDNIDLNNKDFIINKCNVFNNENIKLTLKNVKINFDKSSNGYYQELIADMYINDKYSERILIPNSHYSLNNKMNSNIVYYQDNYFIIMFADESALYTYYYLFNKNGTYITNFREDNEYSNYLLSVEVNNDLLNVNYSKILPEATFVDEYCFYKENSNDTFSIKQKSRIENDKIIVEEQTINSWHEEFNNNKAALAEMGIEKIEDIKCN